MRLATSEFTFDETCRLRLDLMEVVPACLKILGRRRKEAKKAAEAAAVVKPATWPDLGPPLVGPPELAPMPVGKVKQEDLPWNRPEQRGRMVMWNYEARRWELVMSSWARGRDEYDHGVHAGERIGSGPVAGEGDAEAGHEGGVRV